MNKIFKIVLTGLLLTTVLTGCNNKKEVKKGLDIVTTSFVTYDAAKAVVGDDANLEMLLKPGSESHTYEPTPQDIINIEKSDMFIYVGGESDDWVDSVLEDIDTNKTKVIKLMDMVELKEEEIKEGMEHDHEDDADEHHEEHDHEDDADEHHEEHDHEDDADEHHEEHDHEDDADEHHEEHDHEHGYDEHIWTSPVNYIKIVNDLSKEIIKLDTKNEEKYAKNTKNYVNDLTDIDKDIRKIVNKSKNKTLIFADRFPFRYFVEEYNLDYYAAFPGCSEDTEPSASTISFLIDKIKDTKTKYILKTELSSDKIAQTIKGETNTEILVFSAGHNISAKQFEDNITMTDIMKENVKVLEKVLNGTN